ncbi:MAG: NAD(P)/FAD-dependent oxidoreductase [Candidatus Bipolaricaulia bacterium]
MITKDVIIIGGGITGLATAYYLTRHGLNDITIIEKDYVGSGSTGRCGSGIRAQFADKPTIKMMKRAEEGWKELSRELDFEFEQTGYLYLHYTDEGLKRYLKLSELQNSLGVPTEILTPKQAKDVCELIEISEVKGASFNPEDGKAHPFDVVTAFREYFRKSDAELKEGSEVVGMKLNQKGELKLVETPDETYGGKVIVNAAGGWAQKLGNMLNLEIPVKPYRHQAMITEPFTKGTIEPMIISMHHGDAYLTQTSRGGIIGGVGTPEDEPPSFNMTESLEFEKRASRAFGSIIPGLKEARILRHWAGYYAMSPDGNPLLGEYKIPGYYLAAGFSGHGYMMAPSVGKGISNQILGKDTDLPLDYYDPERIDRGELREEALQMG